ncbi:galactoside alpha-(1,2)-fucosyltransferase 2-like isoform X1 [Mytilus trossulus]|uniref:galactoside alpha-(1,2)-fucosyltransferase 2-like isoform X1 n=1 Tax=Mytilus trossulus TaxID=6551 RepID=UPI0030040A7F
MGSSWRIVSCFFSSIRFVYVKMVHINVWNISGHCHRLLQNRTARKLAVICMLLTGIYYTFFNQQSLPDSPYQDLSEKYNCSSIAHLDKIGIKRNKSVCVKFAGGLGNQMFAFCFGYTIARKKNMHLVLTREHILTQYFKLVPYHWKNYDLNAGICGCLPLIEDKGFACGYDKKLEHLPSDEDLSFLGFFQSWRYWKHYENELRQILQFQDNILHEAKSQFHNILSKHKNYQGITTIGVHIRRFERYDTDEFGKNNAPKEYIIHAMDYFRNLYKKCLFLIFSIKMKWTKKNIPQTDDIFLVEGNSAPVDLAMLTLTNHTIMTVGTFGWMAGWMTQGKTVYYKHPDTPGSEFSKLYSNYSDHFYPGWIPME